MNTEEDLRPSAERASYTAAHQAYYPAEYLAGIDLFNAGEFHAAHDAWEDRWLGEVGPREKLFLQAMIQAAVSFYHVEIGRRGAARRMHLLATEKFARLGVPTFMSLDLVNFQAGLDDALGWLHAGPDPRTIEPPAAMRPPRIVLQNELTEYE